MPSPVAIVDIGSNTIKLLVAASGARGQAAALFMRTLDVRISAGISSSEPRLGEAGMSAGIAAVRELLADASRLGAKKIVLVATSAVRDAANGTVFRSRVRLETGLVVRILSGAEEANYIGRGLTCDPALAALRDFYLFDLGGGSLECLVFRERRAVQEVSLPLGCVRLTEKFIADPAAPFGAGTAEEISGAVRAAFATAPFSFSLPDGARAVGTGGTLTCARAVIAAREGKTMEQGDPILPVPILRLLLEELGSLPLAERRTISGLPPRRADVFPAALATLIAIAEIGRFPAYNHSLYNLRWGLAAEELARG